MTSTGCILSNGCGKIGVLNEIIRSLIARSSTDCDQKALGESHTNVIVNPIK